MIAKSYTPEQIEVIQHDGGHAVVAAVAGSGKTETLVGRVRHLLRDHKPNQIAVVMFNRDARESFQRRFEQSKTGSVPEVRTFNSMGNKIVNYFVEHGLLPRAKIIEKDYLRTKIAKDAFTRIFKSINGDDMAPDKELIEGFVSFILLVKSDIHSAEEVFECGHYSKPAAGYSDAFSLYEKQRALQKLRFFEDQLYDPVKLMLNKPETQRLVANKVDHLIVDEAQDVNGIQIALLRILAGTRAKVMLVGDEDQAIYEWRGAKPDYLTRGFERDFSNATRYTLPHTFRFGHTLSLAASYVISENANRNPKISISAEGTPLTRIHCLSLSLGLTGLADYIRDLVSDGTPPNDIAVLVRTYSISVSLELELHQMGVPYFVYGRPPLNRIPEISALVGVLQLASGRWKKLSQNDVSFTLKCLLQRPALYLDRLAINSIVEQVIAQPNRLSDVIRSVITPQTKPFHADQIRDRADLLEIIANSTDPDEKAIDVLERYTKGSNFEKQIEKQAPTVELGQAVLANVEAFKRIASNHEGTIEEFLDELDPLIDASKVDPPKEPHIWIGSIHRAKGAQWPVVFVPGMATSVFPRDNLIDSEIEAERRLFYVAMTRAIDKLYLAHPADPQFTRSTENIDLIVERPLSTPVSSFLWDMELALARHACAAIESERFFSTKSVDRPEIANTYFKRFPFALDWFYSKRLEVSKPATNNDLGERDIPSGTKVRHGIFGIGIVERWVDTRVVRIVFEEGDTRILVAKYAPLTILRQ